MSDDPVKRCEWALGDPALLVYHDAEWGTPEHDDRKLFEFLVLEGAQAGLSWLSVLKKSQAVRNAFPGFYQLQVAPNDVKKVRTLLAAAGVVRNRAKIWGATANS